MSLYKAIEISGTPENFKTIKDYLGKDEAKWFTQVEQGVGNYLLIHPMGYRGVDSVQGENAMRSIFNNTDDVRDTHFVALGYYHD